MGDGILPPLSGCEAEAIAGFSGMERRYFSVIKSNTADFIEKVLYLFPGCPEGVHRAFPSGGRHYELLTIADRCALLRNDGRLLPAGARPLFCRIYPFWFFGSQLHVFPDDLRLALREAGTAEELLPAMEVDPDRLDLIFTQLPQSRDITAPPP